jgi:hypothetical protein
MFFECCRRLKTHRQEQQERNARVSINFIFRFDMYFIIMPNTSSRRLVYNTCKYSFIRNSRETRLYLWHYFEETIGRTYK